MIISRYLPEPALLFAPHSPESAQDDSPTRTSPSVRLGDPGRLGRTARRFGRRRQPGLGQARPPFDRLKPYTVAHQLVHRLKPYEVSDLPLMFRNATWGTLVYWQQLLDSVEVEEAVTV